ncbi:MAG: ArsR family transcriptional regulator [Acidobacteria bacterium]|nr:ArsR family transcriptional regulator [Acidobacteriota bacterium]
MNQVATAILDQMAALGDPIRVRLLLAVERHELTVSELCAVLQLPQSTVSRHLKTLADGGWLTSRRDGTSRYYGMDVQTLDSGARQLWPVIREQMAVSPGVDEDDRRLQGVLTRRREKSREFFSSASGQWDRLRVELFGDRLHLTALLSLLDDTLIVGDLGCGTGQMSDALAPHVARVVAVDGSADMLRAARQRLASRLNVELREGALEALPIDDGVLDAAVISLVLHHQPDPARVLVEAARVLRPGGKVVVMDMLPHDRAEYQQQMGHVWLGFSEDAMRRYLSGAGFTHIRHAALPPDTQAQGPGVFVATGRRS